MVTLEKLIPKPKGEIIFVTNNKIYSKNYLNVFTPLKESYNRFNSLARAIVDFQISFKNFNKFYSDFSNLTVVFPASYSTTQFTESPIFRSRKPITSFGTVVLPDVLFGLATVTFVLYSKTFMFCMFIFSTIYEYALYLPIESHKIYRNIYILVKS